MEEVKIPDIQKMANFQKLCVLSFVPLKRLEEKTNKPIGMASGCIIFYKNSYWLLTVFHAVKDGSWLLEIKYENERQGVKGLLIPYSSFTFLKEIQFSDELKERLKEGGITVFQRFLNETSFLDFAYRKFSEEEILQLPPYYQEILPDRTIRYEEPRRVLHADLSIKPQKEKRYGLAGFTMPQFDGYHLIQNLTIETNLFFDEEKEPFYIFKLGKTHPGHEFYKGCSGAPIIDEEGNLVSLVVGGDRKNSVIFGINLFKYRIAIDVELEIEKTL